MFADAKKGQKVVRIIKTGPLETASIRTIAKVTKKVVTCEGDESLKYDINGREIDPAPGFAAAGISSRLVLLEE